MSKKMLTDAERQERREADRQKARDAVEALRTTDGWQRWLALRRHFHHYTLNNQLLIALQRMGSHCLLGRVAVDIRSDGPVRARDYWISWLGSAAGRDLRCLLDCL